MSRQGTRIAWFFALSAVLHAAILLVGNRSETRIGPAGREIHVSMSYRAGAATPASPAVNPAGRSRVRREQVRAPSRPTQPGTAGKTLSRPHDNPPRGTATPQRITTGQAGNAPATGQSKPATAGVESARQAAEEQLRKSILQLVSSHFDYPLLARRKGWQGIVKLQVHIESNGRISRLHVEQTSGYEVLDRAAIQSLQLASVPDAEQWMQGQAIDIIIPVEYRLVGG
jgi:protein TonB